MMLNKGVWGRERGLAQASVDAMTNDQLVPEQRQGADIFFGNHSSWGFGMGVNIRREKPWIVPGCSGWNGGFGTSAYSDPANDFIGILLTQRMMDSPEPPAGVPGLLGTRISCARNLKAIGRASWPLARAACARPHALPSIPNPDRKA